MPSTPSRTFSVSGVSSAARLAERAVERVEHREEVLDETVGGAVDQRGLLAEHALAVVLEVGLDAPQRVDELGALACSQLRQVGLDGRLRRGDIRLGVGAARLVRRRRTSSVRSR